MPSIPSFSPTSAYAKLSTLAYPTVTPVTQVLTTGGGVVTMTVAQLLGGLLRASTTNAQTFTTPTAALIVAANNGCQVGQAFDVDVINYGASLLTIGLGAGVTVQTIATVAPVLTVATLTAKRLKFVVTNVTPGSEAIDLYAFGATAAAVA
jgi:hypothetical protein